MIMENEILKTIENHLNQKVKAQTAISGGCISDSSIIQMFSGEKYFLKINNHVPKRYVYKGSEWTKRNRKK